MKSFNYFCPNSAQSTNSSSSISTLQEYLTSIGKASWYAIYQAGYEMYANFDGTGGAVADGGVVGCWGPRYNVGFTNKFIMSNAAQRPQYSTSTWDLPSIIGNGSTWRLALDSTTALNLDCSVLVYYFAPNATSGNIFQQNNSQWLIQQATNKPDNIWYEATSADTKNSEHIKINSAYSSGAPTVRRCRVAMSSSGATGRYNFAPGIFGASQYFNGGIARLAFTPRLTYAELAIALRYF